MSAYFRVEKIGTSQTGKTDIFKVSSFGGAYLGEIKYFANWRKYCFYPAAGTVFDVNCLGELSEILFAKTKERKEKDESRNEIQRKSSDNFDS